MNITLQSKSVAVYGEYDVVVIGGGTAGSVAAIAAAREKLKVLLVEQSGTLGGMQTRGLVATIMPNFIEGFPLSSISREIHRRLVARGDCIMEENGYCGEFNPIGMQIVQEELAVESGVEILYHTTFVDIVKNEHYIEYALVCNKDGLSAVKGKYFIDCTADADLCFAAGVLCESGNKNGENQDISLRFEMAQVDIDRYEAFMKKVSKQAGGIRGFLLDKYNKGYIRNADVYHFQTFRVIGKPGCLSFNCPDLGRAVNVIDARYMSLQQIEGKKAVEKLSKFVKAFIPGFENAFITQISPILGIRDSRRILAEYTLTTSDIYEYRKFYDGIAVSNYPLDAHGEDEFGTKTGTYITDVPDGKKYYEIPLRSLVPQNIDNVLCAGRCIGTDFFAQSTIRIQHTCQYMGEAAGIACKIAKETGLPFCKLNGKLVREKMAEYGALMLKNNGEDI